MKKYILLGFILFGLSTSSAYASWLADIFNQIEKTNGIASNILDEEKENLGVQENIEDLMNQVHQSVTGHSGWGNYQLHDFQSYGSNANDWMSVMNLSKQGGGRGDLAEMIRHLSNQFPINQNDFNKSVNDPVSQHYYALKSQTVLATRAASQLDYDKIQQQISFQNMLRQQIENTKDLKSAVDLSSRIQVEGNLINLEILRQTALFNQQQSITEEASVTSALENARFLTKRSQS